MRRYFPLVVMLLLSCARRDQSIKASGTVEATEVKVAAKYGGRIERLLADEGSAVRAGDTLTILAARDDSLRLVQAEARVAQAEDALADADRDRARARELLKSDAAAQDMLDKAELRYELAESNRKLATADLNLLGAKMSENWLVAPIAGRVNLKLAEQGELVGPGMPVFVLLDPDALWVRVYLTSAQLARVKVGAAARIRSEAVPGQTFTGRIAHLAEQAEFIPKTVMTEEVRARQVFAVKVAIQDTTGVLKPGMAVDVFVP